MKSFTIALLSVTVSTGCLFAGDTNKTVTPGTDDLSRYVATSATPDAQTTLRDSAGRTLGTASTTGTRTALRDSGGRATGTAVIEGNRTVFRDASGRTVWTATPSSSQTTTYRDASGRTLGTASKSGAGKPFATPVAVRPERPSAPDQAPLCGTRVAVRWGRRQARAQSADWLLTEPVFNLDGTSDAIS
jgi:hypothetical protein